jgi:hypothetical protein
MLKKILKAASKLSARASKQDSVPVGDNSPLAKKLRQTIADLTRRATDHDRAAQAARAAATQLSHLLERNVPAPANRTQTASTTVPGPKPKSATPSTPKKRTPTAKVVRNTAVRKQSPTIPKTKPRAASKPAARPKASPTLAEAIQHVLKTRHDQNAGGVKAKQLHAEVLQAGYRFGGNNIDNQMNYLHKTLRQHVTRFKLNADGTFVLAA